MISVFTPANTQERLNGPLLINNVATLRSISTVLPRIFHLSMRAGIASTS